MCLIGVHLATSSGQIFMLMIVFSWTPTVVENHPKFSIYIDNDTRV